MNLPWVQHAYLNPLPALPHSILRGHPGCTVPEYPAHANPDWLICFTYGNIHTSRCFHPAFQSSKTVLYLQPFAVRDARYVAISEFHSATD